MLTFDMLVKLHRKTISKINLAYKKPGGSTGYCYIDPTKPLCYSTPHVNTGKPQYGYTKLVDHMEMDHKLKTINKEDCYFCFYKQNSHAMIWVRLQDVEFQNKNREEMLKLIYVD